MPNYSTKKIIDFYIEYQTNRKYAELNPDEEKFVEYSHVLLTGKLREWQSSDPNFNFNEVNFVEVSQEFQAHLKRIFVNNPKLDPLQRLKFNFGISNKDN
jgi:hypothetical protein